MPSLRELILVAQDRVLMERYARQADDSWLLTMFDDPNGVFELASVPANVPLTEVYRFVELPESPGR